MADGYTESDQDRAARALFNRYYDSTRKHVDAQSRQWQELVDAFHGDSDRPKPTGDDKWRSQVFFKYGWQQIQTLAAELAADDDASFIWTPRNPTQSAFAKVASGLVAGQMEQDDYPEKRLLSVLMASVFGACPIKSSWAYECDDITVRDSFGREQQVKATLRDQPTGTVVDPRDFAYDLRGRTAKEWRFAYHRMRMTMGELESPKRSDGSPRYKNLDQLRAWYSGENYTSWSETTNYVTADYASEVERARAQGIEVVEMWTPKRLIVIAQRRFVIRDEPNPYYHRKIPFELVTLQPMLDGPWGHAVMWAIRDVQELLQTLDNANMDALKLAIDPPTVGDMEPDGRGLYPGKHVKSNQGSTGIAAIRVTGIEHFTADAAVQGYLSRMKQTTGITDELGGDSQADSATQAAINQRQAKGRISIMLRFVDAAWARTAERFLQLNQQFLDHTKAHRVTGSDGWQQIQPREIAGMWDVRPKNTSERIVKELDRQNKLEALAGLAPFSETVTPSGYAIDLGPVIRNAVDAFDMDPDDVVVPLDEKLQTDARVSAAQAIMQMQAQGMMQPQIAPQQALPPGAVPGPAQQGPTIEDQAANDPSTATGHSAGQNAYAEAGPGA